MWWNAELKEMTGQQLCELAASSKTASSLVDELMSYHDATVTPGDLLRRIVASHCGLTERALVATLKAERLLWMKAARMEDE